MPIRTITVHSKDAPWMTCELKSQIRKRQLALQQENDTLFRYYRNLVNRNRKKCSGNYYASKISHLKNSKPKNWWREVKQICGHAPLNNHNKDLPSLLAVDDTDRMSFDDQANLINNTFLQPQQAYQPLDESVKICQHLD